MVVVVGIQKEAFLLAALDSWVPNHKLLATPSVGNSSATLADKSDTAAVAADTVAVAVDTVAVVLVDILVEVAGPEGNQEESAEGNQSGEWVVHLVTQIRQQSNILAICYHSVFLLEHRWVRIDQPEEQFGMVEVAVGPLRQENLHYSPVSCAYLVASHNLPLTVLFFVRELNLAHPTTNTCKNQRVTERRDRGATLAMRREHENHRQCSFCFVRTRNHWHNAVVSSLREYLKV